MTSPDQISAAEWACRAAEHVLEKFECAFPDDKRPRHAIAAGRMWAGGELKMTNSRKAAFAAHDAARSAKDASQPQAEAAARAAGYAAATAHVITHAPHACNYALKACDDPTAERLWQRSHKLCDV